MRDQAIRDHLVGFCCSSEVNEIAKINEFNQLFSVVQVTILFFKTFCERLNVTNCSKRFENLLKLSNFYCHVKSQLIPIFFVCVCGGGSQGCNVGHRGTQEECR